MDLAIIASYGMRTPVSTLTHLFAFFAAAILTTRLWRATAGQRGRQLALLCFGVSAMILYGASATYHALQLPSRELLVFQMLDHSAIYLLIAGTYTPVVAVVMRPSLLRDLLLAAVWGLAIAGIAAKWLISAGPYWLTVTPYIVLGWIGLVAVGEILRAVGIRGVTWIVLGGTAYTVGAILDAINWPTLVPQVFGAHELFHVLTMLGTYAHYRFMVRYVIPHVQPISTPVAASPALSLAT